jgi:hypothetical protein
MNNLRRYADLLANMEEYTRAFVKNYNSTGQVMKILKEFFLFSFFLT